VERAVRLESALTSRYGFSLRVDSVEPGLVAAIHPAALRQILIMSLGQLARCAAAPGEILIEARREGNSAVIDARASRPATSELPDRDLIDEILSSQGGSFEVRVDQGCIALCLKVPYTGRVTVLVVDDNPDMVHFYRVCVSGTRYHVLDAPQGQRTVGHIETVAPDIIVLDIILPDIDGWELLERLRDHPATRAIPVIVCSIVREDGLASVLGAISYLPKPIRCPDFLQALDRVADRASTALSRS
jgi:CheY-like chemotaxis protein